MVNKKENMRYLKLVVLFIISNTISIYAQKGKAIFKDELVHELHIDFYDEYNGSNGNRWLDSLYKFHEIAGIEREYIDGVWIETEVKEKYLNARITFDAIVLDSVGVRAKGRTSFTFIENKKIPLKIDFDKFKSKKGQTLDGLKKINLQNELRDNSMMVNKLCYDLHSWMGLKAPRSSFCKLFVNGEYRGLYTIVEQIDKTFLGMHFKDIGNLYKAEQVTFERSVDSIAYDQNWIAQAVSPKTNEKDHNYNDIFKIYDLVENTNVFDIFYGSTNELGDSLIKYIDMEYYIKHLAADVMLGAYDNFTCGANYNIYFYYDLATSKFKTIPWDYNLSFNADKIVNENNFNLIKTKGSLDTLSYSISNPPQYLFYQKINRVGVFGHSSHRKQLFDNICYLSQAYFNDAKIKTDIDNYHNLIKEAVYSDPLKSMTNEQFDQACQNLKTVIDSVHTFYQNELSRESHDCLSFVAMTDFVPEITEVTLSPDEVIFYDINIYPSNATYPAFTWTVDDKDIASTKFYGRIKAKSIGTTFVRITSSNGLIEKEIKVNVVDGITGLSKIEDDNGDFLLYPNPANTTFNIIGIQSVDIKRVEIWSLSGKLSKVFSIEEEFDISDLPRGIYIVKAMKEQGFFSKKLLKY